MRFGPIGLPELIIILILVLVLFGAKRLPEIAKGLGQSVREFRKGIRDMQTEVQQGLQDDDTSSTPPAASHAASRVSVTNEPAKTPTDTDKVTS